MCLTGTLLCQCASGETIVNKSKSKGLDKMLHTLREKKGSDSFAGERTFVLERGVALYVPFATVCFVFALDDKRCTLDTGEPPKRRKKNDGITYAHHVWIPVMSELDAEKPDDQVAWAFSHLTVMQGVLRKSQIEATGWDVWMKALSEVAAKRAASKMVTDSKKVVESDSDDAGSE